MHLWPSVSCKTFMGQAQAAGCGARGLGQAPFLLICALTASLGKRLFSLFCSIRCIQSMRLIMEQAQLQEQEALHHGESLLTVFR